MPDQTEAQLREMTANYGMISLISGWPVIACLNENDILDETIVIYTSDHGDHLEAWIVPEGPML